MVAELLSKYSNHAVNVTINGRPALAILRVSPNGVLTLTTLSFCDGSDECPLLVRELQQDELASFVVAEGRLQFSIDWLVK